MSAFRPSTWFDAYKRVLWWTMDVVGIRTSVTHKFLFAVAIQVTLVALLVSLPLVFLGPDLVLGAFTPGQLAVLGVVVVLAALAFANTILVARRDILDPIVEMREVAEGIARGDLESRPSDPVQVDETGQLERAFVDVHEYLTAVADQAEALRNERFDDEAFDRPVPGELGAALAEMRRSLKDAIRERDRKLARNERALRRFQRVASDRDRDFESKLAELLSLGRTRLGVAYGYLSVIDPESGEQVIVACEGDHEHLADGETFSLERAYCRRILESETLVSFEHPVEWPDDPGHEAFGFGRYVGRAVDVPDDGRVGAICFADDEPGTFTESDRGFVELLALWVSHERKREERIATLRSFKQAVEHAGHPIYWTDDEERIQYVNPAFEEVTGYDASEALGKTPRLLQSGEHDEAFYQDLWETILAGEPWQAETIDERKDGERFVVDQTIAPVTDDDGDIDRFVAVNTDVTDRKEQERRLREHRRELEILRQVLTRVLRHNVRTDLNVIKGTAQLLVDAVDTARESETREGDPDDTDADDAEREYDDGDEVVERAETILETADRLERVSENASTIASLIERKEAVRRYDLAEILERAVEEVGSRFPEVAFEVDCPEECSLEAAEGLDVAIYNLLENGAEHNTADEPTVSVTARWSDGGERVTLTIADNGPGIPDDEVDALLAAEETQLRHGSGAGLWLVKWVVEYSDGRLSFQETDEGTLIRVELPVTVDR